MTGANQEKLNKALAWTEGKSATLSLKEEVDVSLGDRFFLENGEELAAERGFDMLIDCEHIKMRQEKCGCCKWTNVPVACLLGCFVFVLLEMLMQLQCKSCHRQRIEKQQNLSQSCDFWKQPARPRSRPSWCSTFLVELDNTLRLVIDWCNIGAMRLLSHLLSEHQSHLWLTNRGATDCCYDVVTRKREARAFERRLWEQMIGSKLPMVADRWMVWMPCLESSWRIGDSWKEERWSFEIGGEEEGGCQCLLAGEERSYANWRMDKFKAMAIWKQGLKPLLTGERAAEGN
jgi:hypothetical protein